MKGVVFGSGFLGTRIGNELGYGIVPIEEVDVLDIVTLRNFLDNVNSDVVINAVGKTGGPGAIGIDWCETNKEETIQANVSAAINLSVECAKRGIYFVHFGSGCVYYGDNNGKGYSEEDEPNFYGPQFYAKTKIDAERVLKNLPGLILRLRMPIDDRPHLRNLIDKLRGYAKVIDIKNSMTTIPHMISAMKILIKGREQGIYNFVNPGTISAVEIMQMYKEIVNPVHEFGIMSLKELDAITLGKRSNCKLNTEKLKAKVEMPEIHEAVRECLKRYKENMQK